MCLCVSCVCACVRAHVRLRAYEWGWEARERVCVRGCGVAYAWRPMPLQCCVMWVLVHQVGGHPVYLSNERLPAMRGSQECSLTPHVCTGPAGRYRCTEDNTAVF